MPKTKISEYSATANSNTDVASINIDEGCAPSGINNAIRAVMGHLKDFQTGSASDPLTVGGALTTSSTVTHNGGTANGVAYLNGSKVLTTGSALVFDGTNLGLGVTPSAWGTYKAFQLNSAGYSMMGGTSGAIFGALGVNYYFDGSSYRYINNSYATQYNQSAGAHTWSTAASGTAGNAISFTQAMTLDASGRLFLGSTSTGSAGLNVGADCNGTAAGNSCIHVFSTNGAVNGNNGGRITFSDNNSIVYSEIVQLRNGSDTFKINNRAAAALTFGTSDTERARIDSSGNLLVGATSAPSSSVKGWAVQPYANGCYVTSAINNTGSLTHYSFVNPNGQVGSINTSGSSTSYVTSSDYRLKENIAPMTGALATVSQLNPVTYSWKSDGSDGQGFIAHELQAILPDAVVGEKDAVDADGNPKYQGIDTSFLVATLTAAIQEQQAIIEDMKTRLAAAGI